MSRAFRWMKLALFALYIGAGHTLVSASPTTVGRFAISGSFFNALSNAYAGGYAGYFDVDTDLLFGSGLHGELLDWYITVTPDPTSTLTGFVYTRTAAHSVGRWESCGCGAYEFLFADSASERGFDLLTANLDGSPTTLAGVDEIPYVGSDLSDPPDPGRVSRYVEQLDSNTIRRVPEGASWLLVAVALAGLAFRRQRARSTAQSAPAAS